MKLKNERTAGDRLLAVVEYWKLGSKSALAEVLGVTSGAIYTAIKRGKITKQMALSVQGALGISAEWLLKGDEPIEAQVDLSLDFKMKLEIYLYHNIRIFTVSRYLLHIFSRLCITFKEPWD